MPFVTAGIAVARPQTAAIAYTRAGFTAGAGAEFVLSERLTAKAEFRYSDFGSADYGYMLHVTAGTVRAGLNYHFQ